MSGKLSAVTNGEEVYYLKSNLGYIVSAFIIGLSLIVGAYILADGWRPTSVSGETRSLYDGNKNVMNDDELAAYLRITNDDLKKIINQENEAKSKLSFYDRFKFIPYGELNGKHFYLKDHIDKWLLYITENEEK